MSITTLVTPSRGGQSVLPAEALYGNPSDCHTLGPVIAEIKRHTGVEAHHIHIDKVYHGQGDPKQARFWASGQVRRVISVIRREMSAEPPSSQ